MHSKRTNAPFGSYTFLTRPYFKHKHPALFPDRQNNVHPRSLREPGTAAEDTFLFICLANLPRLTGHQPPLSLGPLPPSTSLFDCICTNASIFGGRGVGGWGGVVVVEEEVGSGREAVAVCNEAR